MQDKNNKLAKENTILKTLISQKDQIQEEILKKSIKSEYNTIITYKEMMSALEQSIGILEQSVVQCKNIKMNIEKNRKILSDKTNTTMTYCKAEVPRGEKEPDEIDRTIENNFINFQKEIKVSQKGRKRLEKKLFGGRKK